MSESGVKYRREELSGEGASGRGMRMCLGVHVHVYISGEGASRGDETRGQGQSRGKAGASGAWGGERLVGNTAGFEPLTYLPTHSRTHGHA